MEGAEKAGIARRTDRTLRTWRTVGAERAGRTERTL